MCCIVSMGTFTYTSNDIQMFSSLVSVVASRRLLKMVNRRMNRITRGSSGGNFHATLLASTLGSNVSSRKKGTTTLASSRLNSLKRTLIGTACSRGRRHTTSSCNCRFLGGTNGGP